jgi:phosphatidylethanolamine-binding protein (PEBP) family uncharacterized protein
MVWSKAILASSVAVVLVACSSTAPMSEPDAAAPSDASAELPDATSAVDGSTPLSDASSPDAADAAPSTFVLTSTAFQDKGTLPVVYTCDGAGHSPPLQWSGAPSGTVGYVVLMTTLAKDGLKWNWVLHSIPASATSLAENSTSVGTAGLTSDGPALAYSPPCSQGPGAKDYTFTVYALSGTPALPSTPNQVTGPVVTSSIQSMTLASSSVTVSYTRP